MKTLGLILEINPFHNGHKYFIDEAIKQDNYDCVIAVISGPFCMRGEISVIDKFTKTNLLLNNSIDLIFELPFIQAVNSSDYFTFNSINILSKLGVTDITFGSECGSIEQLFELNKITNSNEYKMAWKANIDKGLSYSLASSKALSELNIDSNLIDEFNKPNNTLALGYISSIKKINPNINIHTIKRIDNNYYDESLNNSKMVSALSLRNSIDNNIDISDYIPNYKYDFVNSEKINDRIYELLKYEFITKDLSDIQNRHMVSEGIENRMLSFVNDASITNYDNFVSNVQTKRYPSSRIKRTILHILLNNQIKDIDQSYLRLLGMSDIGKKYLSKLDKETKNMIISNIKNIKNNETLKIELKASKLYDLLTDKSTFSLEYTTPIKKEHIE